MQRGSEKYRVRGRDTGKAEIEEQTDKETEMQTECKREQTVPPGTAGCRAAGCRTPKCQWSSHAGVFNTAARQNVGGIPMFVWLCMWGVVWVCVCACAGGGARETRQEERDLTVDRVSPCRCCTTSCRERARATEAGRQNRAQTDTARERYSETRSENELIIPRARFRLPHGNMSVVYDELGNRYDLPPYCLSEPSNMIQRDGGGSEAGDRSGVKPLSTLHQPKPP